MRLKTNSGSSKRPTERREDAVTPHMNHRSEGNSFNIKNEPNRAKQSPVSAHMIIDENSDNKANTREQKLVDRNRH